MTTPTISDAERNVIEATSEVREWRWIDRAALGWPSGEWDSEPDKVHWKDGSTGMDCLAVRHRTRGNWCGYVGVTEAHPMFGSGYSELDIDVHGGLTFAGMCQETQGPERGVCHVPFPGDSDRVWWLGFDCAHAGDHSPDDVVRSKQGGIWEIETDSHYRTLDYVKGQCRKLACQLADMALSREPTHD